jgi:hypothetical protein
LGWGDVEGSVGSGLAIVCDEEEEEEEGKEGRNDGE